MRLKASERTLFFFGLHIRQHRGKNLVLVKTTPLPLESSISGASENILGK